MKRLLCIMALIMVFLFTINTSFAQSAKDAIKALKKVESLTKTNIYGRDYLNAYAEAQSEVDMYMGSPKSNKNPKLRNAIERTALAYEWAGKIW